MRELNMHEIEKSIIVLLVITALGTLAGVFVLELPLVLATGVSASGATVGLWLEHSFNRIDEKGE